MFFVSMTSMKSKLRVNTSLLCKMISNVISSNFQENSSSSSSVAFSALFSYRFNVCNELADYGDDGEQEPLRKRKKVENNIRFFFERKKVVSAGSIC